MKRLEREALTADRESVRALLDGITDADPVGQISLTARLSAIEREIQRLEEVNETTGSVALLFSGNPVRGSRSIEAGFATTVLRTFQDLVTKQVASEEFGPLGARGPVPEGTRSTLAIRELVRGSVGFVLEETAINGEIENTPVKKAIDQVATVIVQAAAEFDEEFESSIETLDPRMLVSLRDFFRTLDECRASVQIVEEQREASLDSAAIYRARTRVDTTEVNDVESEAIVGELLGLLPDSRRFEMKLSDTGEIVKGPVSATLASRWLELIESPEEKLVGQVWRTKMRIREVRERNRLPRRLYSLLGLIERR